MARKSRRTLEALGDDEFVGSDEQGEGMELEEGPSRTQRKNASKALTELGEELLAVRPAKLATLELPPRLVEALAEGRRLTSFGARRRQAQFIGKLMRKIDPAIVAAIRKALGTQ